MRWKVNIFVAQISIVIVTTLGVFILLHLIWTRNVDVLSADPPLAHPPEQVSNTHPRTTPSPTTTYLSSSDNKVKVLKKGRCFSDLSNPYVYQ